MTLRKRHRDNTPRGGNMKKLALVLVAVVAVSLTAAPAVAKESGWGCGGACKIVKHHGR
jgi:hypothetical protein